MVDPVTENVVAKRLGVHPGTLRGWRARRKGPPFKRLEGAVRYDPDEVEAWIVRQNPPAEETEQAP